MPGSRFKPTDVSFTNVADMFLAELRNGNRLSVDLLIEGFPHLADEIATQIPALELLEQTMAPPAIPKPVAQDEELGGCQIVREVGRGAVGIVYEALQKELGRKVAVKVIPLAGSASKIAVERFELERQAMGRVEHPNIVPVYSYGHNSRHAYLVMKLIEGHSLYDLQNGLGDFRAKFQFSELRSDWSNLANLGMQVASGLQHAHEQGLVHRDVKPANLLLDASGKVWISDFGLAKIYDYARSLSRTGDAIGTPRYMAPEQLRGFCDARSDVYSLGITLYELAAGQQVWGDKSNLSLVTKRDSIALVGLQELHEDLPPDLARIIMKACEFSPDDRYQTAQELELVLSRFVAGHRPSDRRKRKREPDDVYRKRSRRQLAIYGAGVGLGSVVIGFGAMLWTNRSNTSSDQATMIYESREQDPVKKSSTGLIDKLADNKQGDMVEIVTDFLNESLGESSNELNLSEPTKKELKAQIDQVGHRIKEDGLNAETLDKFLENYRKTSLPTATRIMRVSLLFRNSALSVDEQIAAIELLRLFAAATANGAISEQQVDQSLVSLTGGYAESTEWLGKVSRLVASLPPGATDKNVIATDLNRALNDSFNQSKISRPVLYKEGSKK